MRLPLLLVLLVLLSSCDTVVRLSPQRSLYSPPSTQFKRVGLYIRGDHVPGRLHASINGEPLHSGGITIVVGDAFYGSVENALSEVSDEVILLDTLPTLATMKRLGLDAAFWVQHFSARSQLEREGTLIPSYTTYSSVSLRLMRMSGFRGTIDSLDLTGFGSFTLIATGTGRSRIARAGAEAALQDLATRMAQKLSSSQF